MTRFTTSTLLLSLFAAGLATGCNKKKSTAASVAASSNGVQEAVAVEPLQHTLSDDAISAAVQHELVFDPAIPAAAIDVETTAGVVQLSGTVPNLLARERAARLAELVKGVRAVSDQIQVSPLERTDEAIDADERRVLELDPAVRSYGVAATSTNGVVTLTGTVDTWYEKQIAQRVAEGVRGVRAVNDKITVSYANQRSDPKIRGDVEERLRWDALVDQGLLDVDVHDGVVTLSGTVGSAAERSRARRDAWVPGVLRVDDEGVEVRWWAKDENLRPNDFTEESDDAIKNAIIAAATLDPRVFSFNIRPSVDHGVVTLQGVVDNLKAKAAAEDLARHTVGVGAVRNELQVRPPQPMADARLHDAIIDGLTIDPITEGDDIHVAVDRGAAVLSGTVPTFAEKAEAGDIAMGVLGVRSVQNDIDVTDQSYAFVVEPYLYPYQPYAFEWQTWAPARETLSDDQIRRNIHDEMFWSPFVHADRVKVAVNNGKATLTGNVGSWRERDAAVMDAFEGGATEVDDQLTVKTASK